MSQSGIDLGSLFNAALKTVTANRQKINKMDSEQSNHGDNMVNNLKIIIDALANRSEEAPADALQHAAEELQAKGQSSSSKYYADGLSQAAEKLQGKDQLDKSDILNIVQTLMDAVPSQRSTQQVSGGESVLQSVANLASKQQPQASKKKGPGVGDLLSVASAALPAVMAAMQGGQSGADPISAALPALLSGLMGGQLNPLQASTPRAAAGGLVAQSLLKALLG